MRVGVMSMKPSETRAVRHCARRWRLFCCVLKEQELSGLHLSYSGLYYLM